MLYLLHVPAIHFTLPPSHTHTCTHIGEGIIYEEHSCEEPPVIQCVAHGLNDFNCLKFRGYCKVICCPPLCNTHIHTLAHTHTLSLNLSFHHLYCVSAHFQSNEKPLCFLQLLTTSFCLLTQATRGTVPPPAHSSQMLWGKFWVNCRHGNQINKFV